MRLSTFIAAGTFILLSAFIMKENNSGIVHLIESNGKKAAFLRNAILETGGLGIVHQVRIENAYQEIQKADVITARALANLPELLRLSEPWLKTGSTSLFHKGREFREEVKLVRDLERFSLIEHTSMVDSASAILEIRMEIAQTGPQFPAPKEA